MRLVRLATLYFQSLPPEWNSWAMHFGPAVIRTLPLGKQTPTNGKIRTLVFAEIPLKEFPRVAEDGFVDVPEAERSLCEFAIETAANIISVSIRSSRSISSPTPTVALIPENDIERAELEKTGGIRFQPRGIPNAGIKTELSEALIEGLKDRLDGLALLAEAYSFSYEHPSGQFREYIRLFEVAFAMPATQMGKKLTQFLETGECGYTRSEIEGWLALRHPSSHADGKKTQHFALTGEFVPIIDRMEQAASDVLFNKTDWHNPSRTRRDLWKPVAATTSGTGDFSMERGNPISIRMRVLDTYGAFPFDLSAILEHPPVEWWTKHPKPKNLISGTVVNIKKGRQEVANSP